MDTSADPAIQTKDDATALATRRLTLRAYADHIAQVVEGMDLPGSFLEAERAARAVTVADRMVQQLPLTDDDSTTDTGVVKPPRQRLRVFGDRLLKVIGHIPDPDSFLEGERAGRCVLATDRMLCQLYEAPQTHTGAKAKSSGFADDEDEQESADGSDNEWGAAFLAKVERMTAYYAERCGIWPDGTPCAKGEPVPAYPWDAPDRITLIRCRSDEATQKDKDRWQAILIISRVNAVTRAMARRDGHWPDHSPFQESDPDYYDITARYEQDVLKRPPPDIPHPPDKHDPIGFPWWLVRNPRFPKRMKTQKNDPC